MYLILYDILVARRETLSSSVDLCQQNRLSCVSEADIGRRFWKVPKKPTDREKLGAFSCRHSDDSSNFIMWLMLGYRGIASSS